MNNNDWLDINVLEDYLDGKLDAKAMHRVERLSLEDPFVAEALAGLNASTKRVQSLSILQKQLQDRVAQKPVEKKRWQITTQRLSIAAAAAVLFITVSVLFWMKENRNREQLAANTPKKVEVEIAATKEANPSILKPKEEVEKVIIESKKATYAINSKKNVDKPARSSRPVVEGANSSSVENTSEDISLRAIEIKQKKEIVSKQLSSALSGKVAGLTLNSNRSIRGTIYGTDKVPIPGASVKLKGAAQSTVTDGRGQFSLAMDTALKNPQLSVVSLGFMPKEVNVKNDENLAIELKQNNSALNEVVITSARRRPDMAHGALIRPVPEGGWDEFEEYVLNNNRLLKENRLTGRHVALVVEIDKDGNPKYIEVIKRYETIPIQTQLEEREAIRLVKDGPKWILPKNSYFSTNKVLVKIKF